MRQPEIAVLLSTYERPGHLRRSLRSIEKQRQVEGRFELVVTDDGSSDHTRQVVEAFARQVDFPVRFTTHRHNGFQLSRCRNEGVAVSTAPYLLFTDADCLLPPDHVYWHLACRRTGWVIAGDCYRLDEETSEQVTEAAILRGEFVNGVSRREKRRLAGKAFHAFWYELVRHPRLPRLTGCNIGVWRSDYEAVNGFDENFVGWGLEDRDLQLRLSRQGSRFHSILRRTACYHIWHPPAPSFARNNVGTENLTYYQRKDIPTRCLNGLVKLPLEAAGLRADRPYADDAFESPIPLSLYAPSGRDGVADVPGVPRQGQASRRAA
jgi:glycosyltransferase involved in cell wall biosynthesis